MSVYRFHCESAWGQLISSENDGQLKEIKQAMCVDKSLLLFEILILN